MNKTRAKKYLSAIKSAKGKHLTGEALGRHMGIYSDVIRDELSFFEPIITMDMDYNFRDLIPLIEEYIEKEETKAVKKERVVVRKSELEQYSSVSDFVYKKLTFGGFVDRSIKLSETDLKTLSKLVNAELKSGSSKNKKKRK